MPEIDVTIGGRPFALVCDAGEETSLKQAAGMLDDQARELQDAIGRVPESRMLLMAGLMLADRSKQMELETKAMRERVTDMEERLRNADQKAALASAELSNAVSEKADSKSHADLFDSDQPADLAMLDQTAQKLEAFAEMLENQ